MFVFFSFINNKIEKYFWYVKHFYTKSSLRLQGLSCMQVDLGLLDWSELSWWMIHFPLTVRPGLIHAWLLMLRQREDVNRGHAVVNHWPVCPCGSLWFAWRQWTRLWLNSAFSDQGGGKDGLYGSSRPLKSEPQGLIKTMQAYSLATSSFESSTNDDKDASGTYTLLQGSAKYQSEPGRGGLKGCKGFWGKLCHPACGGMIRWLCLMYSNYTAVF